LFHNIPDAVLARMAALEQMDTTDRADGTGHFERLRQVPPETGRFLSIAAAAAPPGLYIEIGTSAGYSGLWISLACRATGHRLTTFEIADAKIEMARETFRSAGVEDIVEVVQGDARDHLGSQHGVSFCFLDTEKDLYEDCYELVIPNMVHGAIMVADNVMSHEDVLGAFLTRVRGDERVDSVVVPVGSGVLLARKA
jgi:predicted O-methyltransferase YrrM